MGEFGTGVGDVLGAAETPGLRRVFSALLDRCDGLLVEAAGLPGLVRDRRLRLETAVILGLARRLAARLRLGDPVAGRVKLRRVDVAGSLFGALLHVRAA